MATTERNEEVTISTQSSSSAHAVYGTHVSRDATTYSVTLPRDGDLSARRARSYALECSPDHLRPDDVAIVASELATNACVHGIGETYTLHVQPNSEGVWLAVTNQTNGKVPTLDPVWLAENGRGLLAVRGLGRWGYQLDGSTLMVWVHLPDEWSYPDV